MFVFRHNFWTQYAGHVLFNQLYIFQSEPHTSVYILTIFILNTSFFSRSFFRVGWQFRCVHIFAGMALHSALSEAVAFQVCSSGAHTRLLRLAKSVSWTPCPVGEYLTYTETPLEPLGGHQRGKRFICLQPDQANLRLRYLW